jgi:hypothetical protein
LVTGSAGCFFVVETDSMDDIEALLEAAGQLDMGTLVTVRTAKGVHYYYNFDQRLVGLKSDAKVSPSLGATPQVQASLSAPGAATDNQPVTPTNPQLPAFIASYLSGQALQWVTPLFSKADPITANYTTFREAFKKRFADPDEERKAERKLE